MFWRSTAKSRDLADGSILLASQRSFRKLLLFWSLAILAVIATGLAIRQFELSVLSGERQLSFEEEIRTLKAQIAEISANNAVLRTEADELRGVIEGLKHHNGELVAANGQFMKANEELRDALERASLDLEIGAVTRSELERQIVVLNEQLKAIKQELEFAKAARKNR
ncbi:MAG: hypothetical protein KJZ96_13130 [Rhodocyclaceae bacterium]|nr:hypothetical protein [Rhodocyclaceae bacterium]MCL4759279.1 hypothetical protein [Rhodocyclaceae bacterium]